MCWEEILLVVHALLKVSPSVMDSAVAKSRAFGFLLSLDLYLHSQDVLIAMASELRPPQADMGDIMANWKLSLPPLSAAISSKTERVSEAPLRCEDYCLCIWRHRPYPQRIPCSVCEEWKMPGECDRCAYPPGRPFPPRV